MKTSEQTDLIDAAIVVFQAQIEPVGKNKRVEVDGDRAKWSSGYATFAALLGAVREKLGPLGIALYQGGRFTKDSGWVEVTRVACSGQWIEVEYPIKQSRDGAQGFGGGVSFAKRWGLRDLLAIEVPDDHEEAQGYTDAKRDARPAKRAPVPSGLGAMLDAIRKAPAGEPLTFAVSAARAAHPTGEGAAEIEKVIADWFDARCTFAEQNRSIDCHNENRDLANLIKPRSPRVREAIARAGRALEP